LKTRRRRPFERELSLGPRSLPAPPSRRCPALRARLAQTFGIDPEDPDTNAVIHGGKVFFKSDAALTVLGALRGWDRVLRVVPKPLRDAVYNLVARNRYLIFGKCFVPDRIERG
jgi:predicted DCC family thiol-disulfide oxidoreductase YuxK